LRDRPVAVADEEHLIRQHVKSRVGSIVYAAVSPDEEIMGFGFPREERGELLAAEPEKFLPPLPSDERHQWLHVRLPAGRLAPDSS
jgi:hypothetical protein